MQFLTWVSDHPVLVILLIIVLSMATDSLITTWRKGK